jgi:hypothetical protein
MGHERRSSERLKVKVDVQWEGEKGLNHGTIHDINMNGCFVLCSGVIRDGELVKVEVLIPKKKPIALWGEVVNHLDEIGFGMRFTGVGKTESEFLQRLLKRARAKEPSA